MMLAGVAVAIAATVAGIAATGVRIGYFFQPTGLLIVLGGTLGVILITTPANSLACSARALFKLFWSPAAGRELLIDELVHYAKLARTSGLLAIEPEIARAGDPFLRETLLLVLDVKDRAELKSMFETSVRLAERQGEADAKPLEIAGEFAPTLGVLSTVVGLIEVLRQFSNVASMGVGIGTAFVSTIYGLALANLVFLPIAQRMRARSAVVFETRELIVEGGMCLFDGTHPSLVRERLACYLRAAS
jgi:chemotaxis protein MotA